MNVPAAPAPAIDPEALHFLPLGGTGEIGMNLSLYACRGKWLMVDLGISFAGDTLPGVDIMVPDISFIEQRKDDLLAIVLTHAHEDHLGAVAYLWPQLGCPVYATPFAAAILREKLREAGLIKKVPLNEIPLSAKFSLAPSRWNTCRSRIPYRKPIPSSCARRMASCCIPATGSSIRSL